MPVLLPVKIALLWIVSSVVLVSGSFAVGLYFYQAKRWERLQNPDFVITTLVQTRGSKEGLRSEYLEQILGLSADKPQNLYSYSLEEGQKKLLAHPLIREAHIAKIYPNSLFVDYALREPIAIDIDWENCGIDEEGHRFMMRPFLTPKRVPKVYFGSHDEQLPLFKEIKATLDQIPGTHLERIDLSRLTDGWGRREIDIELSQTKGAKQFTYFLRVPTKGWADALQRYERLLMKGMLNGGGIIDLRVDELALIKETS